MVTKALEMGLVILLEAEVGLSISKGCKYLKGRAEPGSCRWFQCRTEGTGHKLGHRGFLLSISKRPCAVQVVEPWHRDQRGCGVSSLGIPTPTWAWGWTSSGCPCWGIG